MALSNPQSVSTSKGTSRIFLPTILLKSGAGRGGGVFPSLPLGLQSAEK